MSSALPETDTGPDGGDLAPQAGRRAGAATAPEDVAELNGRGTTRIQPRVVEKVAAQAVQEVDSATGTARTVLGIAVGSTSQSSSAHVSARVDGDTALVDVTMTVIYPASVREVTRATRRHIRERVLQLTGVQVSEVDITVAGLRADRPDLPRVR